MNDVRSFADIFRSVKLDWDKLDKGEIQGVNREVGEMVLGKASKTMALESVDGQETAARDLSKVMMALESAQDELSRLNGISYSVALRHRDVIGIDVTPDNFTTQVSKKNYTIATENIRALALIGLSAVIVAGIGFIVYKLLTANKKKASGAKDVVKVNREMEKSSELFSSIDLNELPEEAKAIFFEKMEEALHPLVKNVLKKEDYITRGYSAMVASAAYQADINTLEAYRFGAKEDSWLIKPYLEGAGELNRHIKALIGVLKEIGSESRDVVAVKAAALDGSLGKTETVLRQQLGLWSKANGGLVDENGESFIEEVQASSNMPTRIMADVMLDRIEQPTEVPEEREYEQYNKLLDESTKLGKQLEDAYKGIPKGALDDDAMHFLNVIVDNFKIVVSSMDDLAWIVRSEVEALANIYGYRTAAAKSYGRIIGDVINGLEDRDLAKKISEQLKKAVSELPKRRIALESIEEQVANGQFGVRGMATEGLSQTAKIGLIAGVGAGLFALALIGLATMLIKAKGSAQKKADSLDTSFEKFVDKAEKHGPVIAKSKLSEYLKAEKVELPQIVFNTISQRDSDQWDPTNDHRGFAKSLADEVARITKDIDGASKAAERIVASGSSDKSANHLALDTLQYGAGVALAISSLVKCFHGSTAQKPMENISAGFSGKGDELTAEKIHDLQANVAELVDNFFEQSNKPLSVSESSNVNPVLTLDSFKRLKDRKDELVKDVAEVDLSVRPQIEKLSTESKLSGETHKAARAKDENYRITTDMVKASCDFFAFVLKVRLRLGDLYLNTLKRTVDVLDHATGGGKMATESLTWDDYLGAVQEKLPTPFGGYSIGLESLGWGDDGPFFGSGDGVDLVLHETEAYLALPEYSQAGYRFDPRFDVEGANIMAMESWSNGAKLAAGIAAAVGLLGIGALIASTIIKRSSSARESHASGSQLEQAKANWKRLDDVSQTLSEELNATHSRATANEQYMLANPNFHEEYGTLRNKIRKSVDYTVDVGGQQLPIGQVIIDDLGGKDAFAMGTKLSEFGKNSPPKSALDIDHGKVPKRLMDLFKNVIEEPIHDLELGRPSELVLEKLNTYLERTGNALRKELMGDSDDPLLEHLAQADANWHPRGDYNENLTTMMMEPLEFLSIAMASNNMLLDLSDRIGSELGNYQIDEKMLNRFRQVEEQSKGSRDATASILRRIEEFKAPFAIFVRVLRRDQENIDRYLSFIDRYLKSMSKYGKVVTDEYNAVRMRLATINKELDDLK